MRFRVLAGWASITLLALSLFGCNNQPSGPQPPTITTQPAAQTVNAGQTATFSVTATGASPLAYQWFLNQAAIKGATSATYTTPTLVPSDSGNIYFVFITNSNGSAESTPVTVTVNFAPTFTTAKTATFLEGVSGTFVVSVSAVPTATYSESGALPAGVTFTDDKNNNATFAGTATATGSFPITITAQNGLTPNATQNFVLTVTTQSPVITSAPTTIFTVGVQGTYKVSTTGAPVPSITESGAIPSPLTFTDNKDGTATLAGTPTASGSFPFTITAQNGTAPNALQQFTLTVNPHTSPSEGLVRPEDVPTFHNDAARTGQNPNETILTPTNVNAATFGKIGFLPVDGQVDAQPLYLSNVSIAGGGAHNVLYVATEHGSVYAFDADSGAILWQKSLVASGEMPALNHGCNQAAAEIGISGTPVIDRTRGPNGGIYVVTASMDAVGNYFQRLHALDVATGVELQGGPTTIQPAATQVTSVIDKSPGVNTMTVFDPSQSQARSALLLLGGRIFAAWAPSCNSASNSSWIMAFDAATQSLTSALSLPAAGNQADASVGGLQLSADASGNIYLLQSAAGFLSKALGASAPLSLGSPLGAFLKLSTSTGNQSPSSPAFVGTVTASDQAAGFATSGVLVLPDLTEASGNTIHLAVASGSEGNIYVLNRDSLAGGFTRSVVFQELSGALSPAGLAFLPAYFNKTVYFGASGDSIKAFSISNALLSTAPVSQTTTIFGAEGAFPVISSDNSANAILWAVEAGDPAVLHAYDATDLAHELYNSSAAVNGRDSLGSQSKPATPTIANGKVFIATQDGIAVFGQIQR
ncbi:MAG TPA: hypothetical protein VN774_07805 [Candidatus Limnocylindrales bacterium]|nr:hypothetical protein [Candidatus Limnocylindrales bacterium]